MAGKKKRRAPQRVDQGDKDAGKRSSEDMIKTSHIYDVSSCDEIRDFVVKWKDLPDGFNPEPWLPVSVEVARDLTERGKEICLGEMVNKPIMSVPVWVSKLTMMIWPAPRDTITTSFEEIGRMRAVLEHCRTLATHVNRASKYAKILSNCPDKKFVRENVEAINKLALQKSRFKIALDPSTGRPTYDVALEAMEDCQMPMVQSLEKLDHTKTTEDIHAYMNTQLKKAVIEEQKDLQEKVLVFLDKPNRNAGIVIGTQVLPLIRQYNHALTWRVLHVLQNAILCYLGDGVIPRAYWGSMATLPLAVPKDKIPLDIQKDSDDERAYYSALRTPGLHHMFKKAFRKHRGKQQLEKDSCVLTHALWIGVDITRIQHFDELLRRGGYKGRLSPTTTIQKIMEEEATGHEPEVEKEMSQYSSTSMQSSSSAPIFGATADPTGASTSGLETEDMDRS